MSGCYFCLKPGLPLARKDGVDIELCPTHFIWSQECRWAVKFDEYAAVTPGMLEAQLPPSAVVAANAATPLCLGAA